MVYIPNTFNFRLFQETLDKFLYRRRGQEIRAGRLTREQSQRSNSNSYSANTCSSVCNISNTPLRYLETDLAHLKGSKRPLIVTFKRNSRERTHSFSKMDKSASSHPDPSLSNNNEPESRLLLSRTRSKPISFQTIRSDSVPLTIPRECFHISSNNGDTVNGQVKTKNAHTNTSPTASSLLKKAHQFVSRRSSDRKDSLVCSYKSPYESPEMSTNCRILEENLRKILAGLVLYPDGANRLPRRSFRALDNNAPTVHILRKCKSLTNIPSPLQQVNNAITAPNNTIDLANIEVQNTCITDFSNGIH